MSIILTGTATGQAGPFVDDGWAGSGDGWSAEMLPTAGPYESARAIVTPAFLIPTASFAGTVYVDIPLPELPDNVQSITLESITLDGTLLTWNPYNSQATKAATGQIKYGTVDKGASFELPTETGQIVTITDVGTWTMAEIIADALRVYFNCSITSTVQEGSAVALIDRGTIKATWSYTYSAPLLGDPVIIGG